MVPLRSFRIIDSAGDLVSVECWPQNGPRAGAPDNSTAPQQTRQRSPIPKLWALIIENSVLQFGPGKYGPCSARHRRPAGQNAGRW